MHTSLLIIDQIDRNRNAHGIENLFPRIITLKNLETTHVEE